MRNDGHWEYSENICSANPNLSKHAYSMHGLSFGIPIGCCYYCKKHKDEVELDEFNDDGSEENRV